MLVDGANVGLGEMAVDRDVDILTHRLNDRTLDLNNSRWGLDVNVARRGLLNNRLLGSVDVSGRGLDGDDLLRCLDNDGLHLLLLRHIEGSVRLSVGSVEGLLFRHKLRCVGLESRWKPESGLLRGFEKLQCQETGNKSGNNWRKKH